MNNENKTIHEFELNLICDFFSNMERQGPGSPEVTLKALSFIDNLTDKSLIADIGCGTGGQTMVLARHVPGRITGLDFLPGFINIFNRNAKESGLQDRVKGIVGSMDNLPFQQEELDLIWSEGAIYRTEHYFAPANAAREIFLTHHRGNKAAEELMEMSHYEEVLYSKYNRFYGYTFFIAKKIAL